MLLRALLAGLLLAVPIPLSAAGDSEEKPVCDASQYGKLWPPEANKNSHALYESSRTGNLEVCGRGVYKYRWESLTVSYQDLLKRAKARTEASGRGK